MNERIDDFGLVLFTKLPFSTGNLKDVVKKNPYFVRRNRLCGISFSMMSKC